MLSTKQAAERLDVTPQTVRRWFEAGRLQGRQLTERGPIKISEASVDALLGQPQPMKESQT